MNPLNTPKYYSQAWICSTRVALFSLALFAANSLSAQSSSTARADFDHVYLSASAGPSIPIAAFGNKDAETAFIYEPDGFVVGLNRRESGFARIGTHLGGELGIRPFRWLSVFGQVDATRNSANAGQIHNFFNDEVLLRTNCECIRSVEVADYEWLYLGLGLAGHYQLGNHFSASASFSAGKSWLRWPTFAALYFDPGGLDPSGRLYFNRLRNESTLQANAVGVNTAVYYQHGALQFGFSIAIRHARFPYTTENTFVGSSYFEDREDVVRYTTLLPSLSARVSLF